MAPRKRGWKPVFGQNPMRKLIASGLIPTFASRLPRLPLQMLESQELLETYESSGA
jgi:hypothetical protein